MALASSPYGRQRWALGSTRTHQAAATSPLSTSASKATNTRGHRHNRPDPPVRAPAYLLKERLSARPPVRPPGSRQRTGALFARGSRQRGHDPNRPARGLTTGRGRACRLHWAASVYRQSQAPALVSVGAWL